MQPAFTHFIYPSHNKDYGVEQDFLIWLTRNSELLTNNPAEANWHYLPVYWTRWHINHNFAENSDGIAELHFLLKESIIDSEKTFTITQFDGGTLADLGQTIEFSAAKTVNKGINIPILCELHKQPIFPISKKFIGSFNGSFETHPLRKEMEEHFKPNPFINIGGNLPTRSYKRLFQGKQFNINIKASYIALCPRGTSANSFRFYEAMQFGVAPCLIGDIDARPFKKFINWDLFSYYVEDIDKLDYLIKNLDKNEALKKGKLAKKLFYNDLNYQKWCKYVLMELKENAK